MSNFFNYLKKIFPKGKTEKKAKEEEDINTDLNLNIEIKKSDLYEKLEYVVSGVKIKDHNIDNFDTYLKKLNKIISPYNKDETELSYRYRAIMLKDEKMIEGKISHNEGEISDIDKMRIVGKIGTEPTILDTNSASGNYQFVFNRMKICAKDNFPSVRGSNAVYKGKFFYEVQIISNGLMQLGWCTLQTPFKAQEGVGDDITSYAYDGYRLCKWHNGKDTYGQYWDSGDFIGVCIDLNERNIEYFRNGVSLGIAFNNILVGENIAYFPGISMSSEEEIVFNFGKLPFQYQYPGYEPFDLPDCTFTNSIEITIELITLLKNHVLKLIQLNDINSISKIMISNRIFDFIINVSFKDLYILKKYIMPFLSDLATGDLEVFFNYLLKFIVNNEKIEFIIFFFENLCGYIEENALMGNAKFDNWRKLINLFSNLLYVEEICYLWIEGRRYLENFKTIFNFNNLKFNEIFQFLKSNLNPKEHSFYSAMKIFKKQILNEEIQKYEILLTSEMSNLLKRLIKDEKIYKIKNRSVSLQSIIFEYFDTAIEKFQVQDNQNIIMGIVITLLIQINFRDNTLSKENEKLLKNALFSLFALFSEFIYLPLEEFSIDQWFSRSNSTSQYYNEIGIGGTISHVTSEYGSHYDNLMIPKNEKLNSTLFHKVIKVFQIVLPMLRLYSKNFEKTKIIIGSFEKIIEMGYDIIDKIFKFNLSIFTKNKQEILYSIGYFLINLINTYVSKNNNLLYFIPMFTTEIPFEIFKFLLNCKSSILRNSSERMYINQKIIHFKDDNFAYQIVYFYTLLFSDQTIANPELKESFLNRIKYFLNKKRCLKIYEESSLLVSLLIKGILHYMSIDSYASISSEIFLKIIQPWVFGEKPEHKTKNQIIIENITVFFKSDDQAFTKFMDPYNKYLNQIMTEFSIHLQDVTKILNSSNAEDNENKQNQIKKFRNSFNSLSSLMKIMEYLIHAYPKPFLDINSINFSYFASYLKNLSNRIIEKNYLLQVKNYFEKIKNDGLNLEVFNQLLLPIVGLFINISKSENNENYLTFLSKVANLSDLDLDPFFDVYEVLKTQNILNDQDAISLEVYKELIEKLAGLVKKKSDRKMSLEEWEKATKNDDICILCYTNPKDRIILPCKHDCCGDCLIQYLHSKKTCFICNALIENVEEMKINK